MSDDSIGFRNVAKRARHSWKTGNRARDAPKYHILSQGEYDRRTRGGYYDIYYGPSMAYQTQHADAMRGIRLTAAAKRATTHFKVWKMLRQNNLARRVQFAFRRYKAAKRKALGKYLNWQRGKR